MKIEIADSPAPFPATFQRLALWAQASEGRKGRGLALLAIVAYLPAFFGGFVWDDWTFAAEPLIRRFDGIVSIWFSPSELKHEQHYWPVVYTSFWIEHKLWGLHPVGYHAVNVVLHALNSVLVWRLLLRLAVPGAWLVAAVFAVHPVHVESVAWIIERKDLLSALFYLGAAHVWFRFKKAPGPGRYLLCLALFAAALLSKSMVVTLPAALLLLHWWRKGRVTWRDAVPLAPLFVLAFGVTLADWVYYRGRFTSAFDYDLVERALIAARALWIYAGKIVWPLDLPVLYPHWDVHYGDILGWLAIAALVALAAVLWLARGRIGRGPLTGVLFFMLTLLPVLGFVDFGFMRIAFVADRFQYLAMIGPVAAVVGGAIHHAGRFPFRGRAVAMVVSMVALVALGALTWRQSGIYRDALAFAHHVASPPPHYFGQVILTHGLIDAGRYDEAVEAARRSVDLSEGSRAADRSASHFSLGVALLAQDRSVAAEGAFRRAETLWGSRSRVELRLHHARSLVAQARYEEGLALYRTILAEEPDNDLAHLNKGLAFLQSGRYEAAVESFDRALAVVRRLDHEPVLHTLVAQALHKLKRFDAAAARLEQALALHPGAVAILLARVDLELERQRGASPSVAASPGGQGGAGVNGVEAWLARARERCEVAIKREPGRAAARVALGAVFLRMEEHDAAAASLNKALALAPSRPVARRAHRVLGQVLERQGRAEAAAGHYRSALDINPLDAEALDRLGALRLAKARYPDALPLYRRLVKATPFVAQAHVRLGLTLYHLGRLVEALPTVERALELAPDLEEARKLQARVREALASTPALAPVLREATLF